ncbi:MAG: hypothetical protein BRD26_07305 [Bacteroidetes bacterium QH_1_64_81]|nr:MAG: hypothetical protein BRD26_07305 [Bacteroidetes bacterium QH_1_64_81]
MLRPYRAGPRLRSGVVEGTYDIHGLILGREITGIQAFKPLSSPGENGAAEATKEREAATARMVIW